MGKHGAYSGILVKAFQDSQNTELLLAVMPVEADKTAITERVLCKMGTVVYTGRCERPDGIIRRENSMFHGEDGEIRRSVEYRERADCGIRDNLCAAERVCQEQ
jgi:hypothetical protein